MEPAQPTGPARRATATSRFGVGRREGHDATGFYERFTGAGLQRAETLWKALGKATVVHHTRAGARYVLLTTDKPAPAGAGGRALAAVTGTDRTKPVRDVIGLRSQDDLSRLAHHGRAAGTGRRSKGDAPSSLL